MSSATSINGNDAERLPAPAADDPLKRRDSRDALQPWHFFLLLSLLAATIAVVLAREGRPEHLVLISLTIGAAGFAGVALYRTLAPLVAKEEIQPSGALSESMRVVLDREKMLVLRSIKELEFDRAMGKVSSKDFDEMAGRLRARAMSLMRQLDTEAGYRELIERELQARLSTPLTRAKRPARPGSKDPVPTGAERSARPGSEDPGPTTAEPGGLSVAVTESSVAVTESSVAVTESSVVVPGSPVVVPGSLDPGSCACGTVNDADAAFCKRCGAKLATETRA